MGFVVIITVVMRLSRCCCPHTGNGGRSRPFKAILMLPGSAHMNIIYLHGNLEGREGVKVRGTTLDSIPNARCLREILLSL